MGAQDPTQVANWLLLLLLAEPTPCTPTLPLPSKKIVGAGEAQGNTWHQEDDNSGTV